MEQLVILLLIAAISLINWIVQKSKETREKRKLEKRADSTGESLKGAPAEPPPEPEAEISMRRLREALGLPEAAEPPAIPKRVEPPAQPRKPKKQATSPPSLPDEPIAPPPLPRPARKPIVVHVPPVHRPPEHHVFDFPHRTFKPAAKTEAAPRPHSRIRELLGSPGGLRAAVVLSEILGPPKGVRDGRSPL
ncbi:MAG TPA: hypothetical protein VIT18_07180 [Terrimicrobiaceae bacterium]